MRRRTCKRGGESALFLAAVHEDEECARLIEAHLLNIATKGARCVMSAATLKLEAVTSAAMAGFAATKQAAITRKEERYEELKLKRKRQEIAEAL